ncbi:MAG TPA: hypothetical protein VJ398_01075, partial [Acidimicrobiia bacterium]|nr:hypothetical protein [Acidimicrobiia bacterium]
MSDLASLLRDIPGVSDIELDLVSGAVRVRLDAGANYQQVGERVREVLAVTEHLGGGFRAVTVLLEKADGTAAVGAAVVGV